MQLFVSAVLKDLNNEKAPLSRIIHVDDNYVYLIDLTPPYKMPYIKKRTDIQELVDNGFLVFVDDPFFKIRDEENIKERDKAIRDKKFEYVSFVFNENKERFLTKSKRKALFEEAAEKFGENAFNVRRAVSIYLQGGMTPNALLPAYDNIGGKGKEKPDTLIKRGRPREKFKQGEEGPGINVTADIKEKIEKTLESYRHPSQPPLTDAYATFLERYCSNRYYENGELKVKIWSRDKIISYRQFCYHANKILARSKSETLIKRFGQNTYHKKFDPLIGDTTKEAFGPGSKFQIDATHLNVFCVSSENRDCFIGTAVYYEIIDFASHYIPGIYVGLEGPSWMGAAMAINNLVEDKVEFCARYGIEITPGVWPSSLLPEKFLADNGEFAGDMPLPLVKNLGIEIENAPSYRGDCKGIVEGRFNIMKKRLRALPGASIKKMLECGDIDTRHGAIMTIDEVTGIIINEVIAHNNRVMKNFDKGRLGIREPIEPTPLNIWNWGIKNRSCGLIFRDTNMVKLATMPRGKAKITREGIVFEQRRYTCKEAVEQEWFVNPSKTEITVAYDPRFMRYIYIPSEDGRSFITCTLLEKDSFYQNMHYNENKALNKYNSVEKAALEQDKWQARVNDNLAMKQGIKAAKAQKKAQGPSSLSKTAKQRAIKENRVKERDRRRKTEAFVLTDETTVPDSKVLPFKPQEATPNKEKAYVDSLYDYLDQLGEEKNDE